jgi:hypothetical protein
MTAAASNIHTVEMDAVMREALAGRMPFTRLRLAEEVVEAARFVAEHDKRALDPLHPMRQLQAALRTYDQAWSP